MTKVKYRVGPMSVDLKLSYDCWSDPGDYPSNAGAGPLPDGPPYVDDVDGTVTYRLSLEDRWAMIDYPTLEEWAADNITLDLDESTWVKKWGIHSSSTAEVLVLLVEEWKGDD